MAVSSFAELREHIGHKIECVCYGDPVVNVAIECEDCGCVLFDFDSPDQEECKTGKCKHRTPKPKKRS